MWYLIIQGTWEIKTAESTQHPPLSFIPVIASSYFFSFLFFPLAWQRLKVYLLIYSVSAPCPHVSQNATTHDQKTEMRKTRFSPLLFPHPHSLTANYVLTNQSTPASGRKGKKKGMKDCYLIAIYHRKDCVEAA